MLSYLSKAFDLFKHFITEVENQKEKSIKALHVDKGWEYISDQFREFCANKGICQHKVVVGLLKEGI